MEKKCVLIDARGLASKLNGSPKFGELSSSDNLTVCNQAYGVGADGKAVNCNLRYLATLSGGREDLGFRCKRTPPAKPTSSPKS